MHVSTGFHTFRMALAITILSALTSTGIAAQGGSELVRGQVSTPDSLPLAGADITVTGLLSQSVRTTRTNDEGVFTVLFADGEGEYVVRVRSLGFAPLTRRVLRTGESNVLVANVRMSPATTMLDTVTVESAARPRTSQDGSSIGGNDQDALQGALFSLDATDLDELALNVPGVYAIPGTDGYSVLGAGPDANNTTVDGSSFSGSALPTGAIAGATLSTATFDPGRGGFNGGQLAITTRGGRDIFEGKLEAKVADPHLAWADPASPVQTSRTLTWNGSAGGPIVKGKAYYFGALDIRRSTRDTRSLTSLNDALLQQYGLSTDTINALAGALGSAGIPLTAGGDANENIGDRKSAFVRFDLLPTASTSMSLTGTGTWNGQDGVGISPLGFPSLGGGNESSNLGLTLAVSTYFRGLLDELKSSVQTSSSSSQPYLLLPHGTVRVGADRPDASGGIVPLSFGGGSSGSSETHSRAWETRNEISWLTTDSRHQLKFGQSFTASRSVSRNASNVGGTFSYQSMEDFIANRPGSYSRTLSSRERTSNALSGALWVGGVSRSRSSAFQLQYGLRLDLARPGEVPAYNPVVDSLFSLRTDHVPTGVGLSPRLGFSWTPGGSSSTAMPRGGFAARGRGMTRMAMGGFGRQRITISGGVGAFRGVVQPGMISGMVDATGLPNTIKQLTCVGDATPIPDWSLYLGDPGAAPTECLDGTAPAEFSSDRPNVRIFDPSFQAPISWRGTLQLNGLSYHDWGIGLSYTYSLGLHAQSGVDLNLQRTPEFSLPTEDDRPVFVSTDAIVPSTGLVAPGASRITQRFGSVTSYLSDLRSVASQFNVSLNSSKPLFGKLPFNITYTYQSQRAQERGFDGSTAGDPFRRDWAAGQQPTHQFMFFTSFNKKWFSISLRGVLTSGIPYTPMIMGDVNGDGRSNDRAFVFDPGSASDTILASQMRSLLATAPDRVRSCLEKQLGQIAGRNSCRTGWQLRPDINLGLTPPLPGVGADGNRLEFSVTTVNAMGAVLRLFGLEDTQFGSMTASGRDFDRTLLYVDGFDPATKEYRYRVNQLFGELGSRRSGARRSRFRNPFQVELGVSYHFGGPPRRTLVRSLGLVPEDKDDAPLTEKEVRARLERLTRNPLGRILSLRDSLLLTEKQLSRIQRLSSEFDAKADSLLAPIVGYVLEHGRKTKDSELQKQIGKVMPEMAKLMTATLERAGEELTAEQKERLPRQLRASLSRSKPE